MKFTRAQATDENSGKWAAVFEPQIQCSGGASVFTKTFS
jgi:hypothetical protein